MLILCAKIALNVAICMIFFNIFLDNGVMNSPKCRILSLVFTLIFFHLFILNAVFLYFLRCSLMCLFNLKTNQNVIPKLFISLSSEVRTQTP